MVNLIKIYLPSKLINESRKHKDLDIEDESLI